MATVFEVCNIKYFEGKLLYPQFSLIHSFKTCGYFCCQMKGWFNTRLYDPTISMTDYYDFTEKQFKDIMVHEMIHYYLAYYGIDRRCKHGKKFMEMAKRLNRKYGLNITPYLDLSKYKRSNKSPKFTYWLLQKIGYI